MTAEQISQPILVVVGNEPGSTPPAPAASALKAVGLAARLTEGGVHVLSVAPETDAEALAAAGADVIYLPDADGYSPRVAGHVADAARGALAQIGEAGAVLTVADYTGKALAGMLGVTEGAGAAVDVNSVSVEKGSLIADKSVLGGEWFTRFAVGGGTPVLAVRAGVGEDGIGGSGDVQTLQFDLSDASKAVTVVESKPEAKGARVHPTMADVVVVGGRGAGSDFQMVERLADVLGAGVGATRVPCDEGWVERSAQIGQTGLTIAPKVYIGLGVSGQVHHTSGMLASEKIVAVVDDPDAPIAEIADFVVIGDVDDVVPQAIDELQRLGAS